MNEPFDLDRLLSSAADDFRPTPDTLRLEALIMRRGHRRRMLVVAGAAASVLLLGSVALAHRVDESRERLGPAHNEDVIDSTSTTEKVREPLSTKPKPTEPTEPKVTEPTEPKVTEPKPTEPKPKPTEPKPTEPKPTEPTEPKPTEPEWKFKAYQEFGACSEAPPYDVFYGETKPGAKVVIESEWSERIELYADENGHWEVQVFFPESPIGQEIKVWVVSMEQTYKFWFTHTEAA